MDKYATEQNIFMAEKKNKFFSSSKMTVTSPSYIM